MSDTKPEREPNGYWTKGCTSPNPQGRPKGSVSLRTLLVEELRKCPDDEDVRTYAERFISKTIDDALKGDTRARALLFDRIDGKAPQAIELSGRADRPIAHVDLSRLDTEQVKALYALLAIAEHTDDE